MNKIIALICTAGLLLGLCHDYAISSIPYNPAENQNVTFGTPYARVTSFANYMSDTLVINIQDYHSDYDSQIAIKNLLEKIHDSDKKVEIYLEGAYTELDLSHFDYIKKLPEFDGFADTLLENGKITGAELFALKRNGVKLNGLENLDLYLKNLKNLSHLISQRTEIISDFNVYLNRIDQEITANLNPPNKKIYNIKQKYEKNRITHEKYTAALLKYASKNDLDIKTIYPNVYKSGMVYALRSTINFKKVNSDMPDFLSFVKSVLSYKDYLKVENAENKFYMLGRIYRDYSFKTPALTKFFQYTDYADTLNRAFLLKEEDDLFWNIMTLQCDSTFRKQSVESLRILGYSQRLLYGDIVSYEHEYLTKNNDIFDVSFTKYAGVPLSESIKNYYNLSKEFYAINEERNAVFVEKSGIEKNDDPKYGAGGISEAFSKASVIKVLVTGGYHSEGLSEILKQNGVSYIVFTPEITSANNEAKDLYEHSINIQAKAAFSAFQKFLNFQKMIISDNAFNVQKFCELMLDYDTVNFFVNQKSEGKEFREQFAAGIVKQINNNIAQENRVKSLDIDIVSKERNAISIVVTVELENGSQITNLYKSINDKPLSAKNPPIRNIIINAIAGKGRPANIKSNRNFAFEMYKNKINGCIGNFELQTQFCRENALSSELEIIAPEILKNAAELMEAIKALDKIYADLDYLRQSDCEKLIMEASGKYFDIVSSNFDFGTKYESFGKTSERLKKLISDFGLEAHEDMQERLHNISENIYAKSPRKTTKEIENKTMEYFAKNIGSQIPVFAYAAQEAHKMLGDEYDADAADMTFIKLKDGFFRKNSIKRAGSFRNIANALSSQSSEIFPYLASKNFDIENQEETEDILIRSLAALEILESYPEYAQIEEIIKISEELFIKTAGTIDIKASENAYLTALEDNDTQNIEKLRKEMNDKIEYARRLTVFQNELIKVIASLGRQNSDSAETSRIFLLKVADGSILDGNKGTEGMYWLRQQSILRLKDFNHPETIFVLDNIIESEKLGEMSQVDSVFMSINLEASNAKTLSLKLHCAGVLIDFKRQDAKNLLKNSTSAYFNVLKTLPAKDRFAYIAAAADLMADQTVPSQVKADIFKGFALTGDNDILFSANILLDFALNEFNLSKVNSVQRENIIDFLEAFAASLSQLSASKLLNINSNIKILKSSDSNAEKILSDILADMRFELGNMGNGKTKKLDWIADYNVFMISGGGVTEEIVRLGNMDFSGNIAGLMSANDDGGSTLLCRGYNADKNGIYSVAQGDIVNFIASAAALDGSSAPLKSILKGLMNTRFEENIPMKAALDKMKDEYEQMAGEKLKDKFTVFWEKLEQYAAICDAFGISIANNSLKNLIFEAMALDNKAYGEGFVNPDGVYSAMKDFADLLETKSVAVAGLPYGNITTVSTKGGIEYIGQSYFSHTPHVLSGGRTRSFWTPENIGEVFEPVQLESRVAKGLSQAKVIVAGLCSWITSLGVQLANRDISQALEANVKADKILITNPVKDDENTMSWGESTVAFLQRVTKIKTEKMFNTVFAWQSVARDKKVSIGNLTEKEIFEGKAGGYRGENTISVSGTKLMDKLKMKVHIISGSIDIDPVERRDDPTKVNYKIIANPQIIAEKILLALSRKSSNLVYGHTMLSESENIRNSRLAGSTALFFGLENAEALSRAEALRQFGVNSFTFIPVSKAEMEKIKLGQGITPLQNYKNISFPEGFGKENTLFFSTQDDGNAISTKCYYSIEDPEREKAAVKALAQWFKYELPALCENKLMRNEQISVIESIASEIDFDEINFNGSPLKVLIGDNSSPLYDFAINAKKASDTEKYISTILNEMRKPIYDLSYKLNRYKELDNFGDKRNEALLSELKELIVSIGAWDDVAKRSAVLYAVKAGFDTKVTRGGINFMDSSGKVMDFYIDAAGKFQASDSFMSKMRYLEGMKVFADMDDNIAARKTSFSDEMRTVFADLTLYGICSPVIITGNTDKTLWLRLRDLPEVVLEETVFYTEVGGLRYTWHKTESDDGSENSNFVIDKDYTENIVKTGIPVDIREKIRTITSSVDYQFDDLFVSFVKDTHNMTNYQQVAAAALKKYSENNEMMKLLKKITGQGTKNLLMIYWNNLNQGEVQRILDDILAVYIDELAASLHGLDASLSEVQYLEILKIVSLLEYSRISFSTHAEDKDNKSVLLDENDRTRIINGSYEKTEADSLVRISLTPIRVKHINKKIAELYSSKFLTIAELKEYKVESSGRTTINIMKLNCQKTLPIEHELNIMGIPAKNIVYSGDEVYLPGMKPANSGIDDSVAKLGLKEANKHMFVVNTNLSEHNKEARPNLVWLADIMRKSGISVNSPVDAGTLLHEKILERLEYNFANIMADENFVPENIIELFKKTLSDGSVDYPLSKDFISSIEEQKGMRISIENISSLLSAA